MLVWPVKKSGKKNDAVEKKYNNKSYFQLATIYVENQYVRIYSGQIIKNIYFLVLHANC